MSNPVHPRLLLVFFFGFLLPLLGFLWLAEAVHHQKDLVWDAAILKCLQGSRTPWLDQIATSAARSGRIDFVVVLAVLGVLVLKRKRRLRDAFFVTATVFGVVIINLLVRTVVQRHQSEVWGTFAPTFDFGFPSSQAADTLTVVLAFAILAWSTQWRWTVTLLGAFYVLAVGASQVYLGGHYPSDIVAGWELALAWVTLMSFIRLLPIKP